MSINDVNLLTPLPNATPQQGKLKGTQVKSNQPSKPAEKTFLRV